MPGVFADEEQLAAKAEPDGMRFIGTVTGYPVRRQTTLNNGAVLAFCSKKQAFLRRNRKPGMVIVDHTDGFAFIQQIVQGVRIRFDLRFHAILIQIERLRVMYNRFVLYIERHFAGGCFFRIH